MLSSWKRLTQAVGLGSRSTLADRAPLDRKSIEVFARVAHEARQPLSAAAVYCGVVGEIHLDASKVLSSASRSIVPTSVHTPRNSSPDSLR